MIILSRNSIDRATLPWTLRFAWFPVWLEDGTFAWWEILERKYIDGPGAETGYFIYRLPERIDRNELV